LEVSILDNTLSIRGMKPEPQVEEELIRYLRVERSYGKFHRDIPLSCVVDVSDAQAELCDGVLTITLPRRKNRRGREFSVTVKKHDA
jgi:HSP20 family protein